MKEILLVILFNLGGELTFVEGYMPIQQPSMETCKERAEFARSYLEGSGEGENVAAILCGDKDSIQDVVNAMQAAMGEQT